MVNKYMMLDRLVQDGKYYADNLLVSDKYLYYGNVETHTAEIRKLYNSFTGRRGDEKPEWFTEKDMLDLITRMVQKQMMVRAQEKMLTVIENLKDNGEFDVAVKVYKKGWKFFYNNTPDEAYDILVNKRCYGNCSECEHEDCPLK